jgi:hypothetical protein
MILNYNWVIFFAICIKKNEFHNQKYVSVLDTHGLNY